MVNSKGNEVILRGHRHRRRLPLPLYNEEKNKIGSFYELGLLIMVRSERSNPEKSDHQND